MRLAFKMCLILLLLAAAAESQEQVPATQAPDTPPLQPATRRPRPQRIVRPQPHLQDPWYPDPPPEGGVTATQPQPPTGSPAATAPAAPQVTPVSQSAPAPRQAEDLGPASPPQVAYRDGQLTVRAINSTLESVLTAIRNKAGVQFEGLESGASERVAISMGPLPEGEVLAAILGGSRFDFVVVERPDSPGIVQRVLLSARKGSLPVTAGTQPVARPAASDEDENPDEGSVEAESPQDTPARPPVMQAQPQMQINPPPPQPQPGQATSGPKTPEELLEELKQMQQRQQQQQQQPQQQPPPLKQPPL